MPTFKLTGKVTDANLGTPIPDADVRILNLSKKTVTDKKGKYTFKNLNPCRILVEASLAYNPLEKDKTITTSNVTIDFKLTKA